MEFAKARTEEQYLKRKQDIKLACITVFDKEGYDSVKLNRISEITTIKRSTIYTYYNVLSESLMH